ncbi:hypothetical protein AHAS_Ahas17G0255100 [Arachis hypogaea]
MEALNGKQLNAVITDSAKAMKLAIEKVFPDAHHRKCMLGDYEIDEFEERWTSIVNSFGIKDMEWVETTYGIKDM